MFHVHTIGGQQEQRVTTLWAESDLVDLLFDLQTLQAVKLGFMGLELGVQLVVSSRGPRWTHPRPLRFTSSPHRERIAQTTTRNPSRQGSWRDVTGSAPNRTLPQTIHKNRKEGRRRCAKQGTATGTNSRGKPQENNT